MKDKPKKLEKKRSEILLKENLLILIILIFMFFLIVLLYFLFNIYKIEFSLFKNDSRENLIIKFNNETYLNSKVANTALEKTVGLMFRESLDKNSGMMFNFSSEELRSFWMKNTYISLDIIFINNELEIVDIIFNMTPCKLDPCITYNSSEPFRYAIEVNSGYVDDHNIKIGDKIEFIINSSNMEKENKKESKNSEEIIIGI